MLELRRAEVAPGSFVVVTEGSPELSGRSEEGTGSVVIDTIPGMIITSVEEEDGTEVWLSLEMERGMETGPVVLVEIVGSENTDSVVGMLVTSMMEVSTGNGTTAVELVPSRMLVIMSVSDGSKMVDEAGPVVPGPVIPSKVEVGVSMTEVSSPLAVVVGVGVLIGSSSAAVEVSMAVEETPVPLPVIPDSVSVAALLVSLDSFSRMVEVGSSEEVRIPDGPKVISLSVLVSSSLVLEEEDSDAASEVVSVDDSDVGSLDDFSSELELEKIEDSELDSASDVVEVELGRITKSGSPRVVPISSSSSSEVVTVEEVGIGAGRSVDVFPSSMTTVLDTTTVFTTVGGWDTGSKSDATSDSKSVVLKDEVVVGRVLFRTWRLTCFGK